VDILYIFMSHAAKRSTDKIRGLLVQERDVDMIQLRVIFDVHNEKAHEGCLLRHGEAGHAIVDTNENNFASLREIEPQTHIVPSLNFLVAVFPGIELDERRCPFFDQINLMVLVRL